MNKPLDQIEMPDQATFVERFIAKRQPVVVTGLDFDAEQWTPEAINDRLGDLTALVYGHLFDLDDIQTLEDYIEDWFDLEEEDDDEVPYVRWYNKLRDVDFAWGDEAFTRIAPTWSPPPCLPTDFLVPVTAHGAGSNPVSDPFPYRGIQVAARGARTSLHRDPFATDAVVCQYYGTKHAVLYRPERAAELAASADNTTSFGGFIDIREDTGPGLTVEPDYQGTLLPGQMIYVPRGWLHDVYVIDDSLSVTWNFVHQQGAAEFLAYLNESPETDTEFEILRYFHQLVDMPPTLSAGQIADLHRPSALSDSRP